jgi:hypothetical protein
MLPSGKKLSFISVCISGTYSTEGNSGCTPCPNGWWTEEMGATSNTSCNGQCTMHIYVCRHNHIYTAKNSNAVIVVMIMAAIGHDHGSNNSGVFESEILQSSQHVNFFKS